jgi:hypothetical protein
MDLLFVSRRRELANMLEYHLKPVGLDVVLKTDPAGLVLEEDTDPLPIVLFDADAFPRHWKALLMHLRSFHSRPDAVFVLLTSRDLEPEEAAKASHLGVNGIVTEDLSEKRGVLRLIDVLRRYKLIQDKRSFTRYPVSDTDRVGFAFFHPASESLVTGEVTEVSVKGLSFVPDRPERCAALPLGAGLARCSLRVGDRIVTVSCRVMRAGRDLGLQFSTYEEGARDAIRTYIEDRPERALRAAIDAGRGQPPAAAVAGGHAADGERAGGAACTSSPAGCAAAGSST